MYEQEMGSPHLQVAYVDQNNKPVVWKDARGNLFGYGPGGDMLVRVDQQGKPIVQQDSAGTLYMFDQVGNPFPVDQYGVPLIQPRQHATMGQQKNQGFTPPRRNTRKYGTYGRQASVYQPTMPQQQTFSSNRFQQYANQGPTNQNVANPAEEQNVVNSGTECNIIDLSQYVPKNGSELIPLFDETKEKVDVVIDDKTKTYSFIVINK